jgi:hypothetical protein
MEKIKIFLFGLFMFFLGNYYSIIDLKNILSYIGNKIIPSNPKLGVAIIFGVLLFLILKIDFKSKLNRFRLKQKF